MCGEALVFIRADVTVGGGLIRSGENDAMMGGLRKHGLGAVSKASGAKLAREAAYLWHFRGLVMAKARGRIGDTREAVEAVGIGGTGQKAIQGTKPGRLPFQMPVQRT